MSGKHRALVVEDDQPTADEFAHILRAEGFDVSAVDNAKDGLRQVTEENYCLMVSDLDIKEEPDSLKGHTAHGSRLIESVRAIFPGKAGGVPCMPIVVVSGRVRGANPAVELMKAGADDVVQKPLTRSKLSKAVAEAMRVCGVEHHRDCSRIHRSTGGLTPAVIRLAIPGDRTGRRTRIKIGGHDADLSESALQILLRLMVARLEGQPVHKTTLGAKPDEPGFKGISRLREEIGHAVVKALRPIGNDQRGNYWLVDEIAVGDCDTDKLAQLGNATISELARQLERLQASDGKGT